MPRIRTSTDDMAAVAVADLAVALTNAGFEIARTGRRSIEASFDGRRLHLDIVAAAYATASRVGELVEAEPTRGRGSVLVADRITADARRELADAGWGWLDRRGHLHLRSPGVLIDADVTTSTRGARVRDEPIRGRAGIAVAYRLLTNPIEPVSPTRSGLQFAPSTLSEAITHLRNAGLAGPDGLPVLPELFWALADRWSPERTWLATEPSPASEDTANWCISGTIAAAEYGAPVVAPGAVPDLYVPGPVAVTIAARRYGVARDASTAAASIAVAPTSELTDRPIARPEQEWPFAHRVAVALDLAQDRARGREILEDWNPPERVW